MSFRKITENLNQDPNIEVGQIIMSYLEEKEKINLLSQLSDPKEKEINNFKNSEKIKSYKMKSVYDERDILRHFGRELLQAQFVEAYHDLPAGLKIVISAQDFKKYGIDELHSWLQDNFPELRIYQYQPINGPGDDPYLIVEKGGEFLLKELDEVRRNVLDESLDNFSEELLAANVENYRLVIRMNNPEKNYDRFVRNLRVVFPEIYEDKDAGVAIIKGFFNCGTEARIRIQERAQERAIAARAKVAAVHEQLIDTHGSDMIQLISEYDVDYAFRNYRG